VPDARPLQQPDKLFGGAIAVPYGVCCRHSETRPSSSSKSRRPEKRIVWSAVISCKERLSWA
jgi:hypothetical protein